MTTQVKDISFVFVRRRRRTTLQLYCLVEREDGKITPILLGKRIEYGNIEQIEQALKKGEKLFEKYFSPEHCVIYNEKANAFLKTVLEGEAPIISFREYIQILQKNKEPEEIEDTLSLSEQAISAFSKAIFDETNADEITKQALEILKDSDPENRITEILMNVVCGKNFENVRMTLLIALTGYLEERAHLALTGESTVGKSHILRTVLSLFPKEDIFVVDYVTGAGLRYYKDEQELEDEIPFIRLLVIYELPPQKDLLFTLRGATDKGELISAIAGRSSTGEMRTEKHQVRIGCLLTTTTEIFQKNEQLKQLWMRLFEIEPDSSEEATAEVLVKQLCETKSNKFLELEIARRAIHMIIEYVKKFSDVVKVPRFVCRSFLPTDKLGEIIKKAPIPDEGKRRFRRDVEKIFAITGSLALLNIYNRLIIYREKEEEGEIKRELYILPAPSDFYKAVKYITQISWRFYLVLPKRFQKILEILEELEQQAKDGKLPDNMFEQSENGERYYFPTKVIAAASRLAPATVRVYLSVLEASIGCVESRKSSKDGRITVWGLATKPNENMPIFSIFQTFFVDVERTLEDWINQLWDGSTIFVIKLPDFCKQITKREELEELLREYLEKEKERAKSFEEENMNRIRELFAEYLEETKEETESEETQEETKEEEKEETTKVQTTSQKERLLREYEEYAKQILEQIKYEEEKIGKA